MSLSAVRKSKFCLFFNIPLAFSINQDQLSSSIKDLFLKFLKLFSSANQKQNSLSNKSQTCKKTLIKTETNLKKQQRTLWLSKKKI